MPLHPLDLSLIDASADGDAQAVRDVLLSIDKAKGAGWLARLAARAGIQIAALGPVGSMARLPYSQGGSTALGMAAEHGREACVIILRKYSDCNAADSSGLTPLMRATRNGHARVIAALSGHCDPNLIRKANPSAGDHGCALHYAAQMRRVDAIDALISMQGIDLNLMGLMGQNALMAACATPSNLLCIEKLLAAHPGLAIKRDAQGQTALMIAARIGDEKSLAALVGKSDVLDRDAKRWTAKMHADNAGNHYLAKALGSCERNARIAKSSSELVIVSELRAGHAAGSAPHRR